MSSGWRSWERPRRASGHKGAVTLSGPFRNTSQIEAIERDIGFAKADFLRRRGWETTSDHPGALWLWEFKGKSGATYYKGVSTQTAIAIEAAWESGTWKKPKPAEKKGIRR